MEAIIQSLNKLAAAVVSQTAKDIKKGILDKPTDLTDFEKEMILREETKEPGNWQLGLDLVLFRRQLNDLSEEINRNFINAFTPHHGKIMGQPIDEILDWASFKEIGKTGNAIIDPSEQPIVVVSVGRGVDGVVPGAVLLAKRGTGTAHGGSPYLIYKFEDTIGFLGNI